jgi:SsrA-binding protein
MANNINIKNKKAYRDFEIEEKLIAGIQLLGTEIKSIRKGKVSLAESWCYFDNGELFVKGMHIAEYALGTHKNHQPLRVRKLLLNRRELQKWEKKVNERGYTIIALRLFVSDAGYAKLEIGLARGKRQYDKREDIKKKDLVRESERRIKL